MAKQKNINVESLLGITIHRPEYIYSAIMGDCSPEEFTKLFEYYRQLEFTDFKIKLSNVIAKERKKLACMREQMDEITVRADANNLWNSTDIAINYLNDLDFEFLAIEEPIKSKQLNDLQTIANETGLKIILDESLLRSSQIEAFKENPSNWIVNARVSKYGGLLRSLKIIKELVSSDIGVVVGAHVGETSLLTRTALILADAANNKLRAQEGGFSTHLLSYDLFEPNLKIGKKGKLDSRLLECRKVPGFGLQLCNNIEEIPDITNLSLN